MTTKIDADAIRGVADNIGKLMTEHKAAFGALEHHWPNAGKFPRAQWVERVIDDRRNAVVAHADHLALTFEAMTVKLKAIADNFENADGDNATAIKNVLAGLEAQISGEITVFDQNTENEQSNYSGPGTPTDGDGYNDNLNQAVGGLPAQESSTPDQQAADQKPKDEPWNAYTNPDADTNHDPKPNEYGWVE